MYYSQRISDPFKKALIYAQIRVQKFSLAAEASLSYELRLPETR